MRCAAALPPGAEGPGGHPGGGYRQQRRGEGEPRSAACGRIVSCHFHQVGDLQRSRREEPETWERAFQRGGDREHEVVPFGQVRALMRQDRIELAIV